MSDSGYRKLAGLFGAALVLLATGPSRAADVEMAVAATPRQIYLGDTVTLTVKVSGIGHAPEPDLSAIQNCTVVRQGSQDQNYQHVTIINGKMERTGFRGRIFTYNVTPRETGRIPLGPVRLAHEGDTYQATGPVVTVVGAEKQDRVLVRLEASRDTVIVNEPFEITVAVSIRRLDGSYAGIDPFDTSNPPDLTVPHLQFQARPGLAGDDPQTILQSRVISGRRSAGFGINGINLNRNPINSFFSFDPMHADSRAIFRFERSEDTLRGKPYLTYRLTTRHVPKQEGAYAFGPIVFKGRAFTAVDAAGQATTRRIFASAPALTVRVAPPPRKGRPGSYVGAIGSNLVVDASLDTQTCNVGDPLRLTLTVRGAMSVDNLRAPRLGRQEALLDAFRVYDDTVEAETLDDGKAFTCIVRPIRAGTLELPPIEVAYYDSQARRYEIVRSEPIPLVAYQAAEVQENFVLAATNQPTRGAEVEREGLPIPAPITVTPTGSLPVPPWLAVWQAITLAAGPAAFAFLGLVALIRFRLTSTADSRKRRAALAKGRRLIEQAVRKAGRAPDEGRTLLFAGLRKYLAHRLGGTESGLTPRDAARLLREQEVDPELARTLVEILDRTFNAQYDPSAASNQDLAKDTRAVRAALRRLEKTVLLVGLLCGLGLAAARADEMRHRFLWEEANTRVGTSVQQEGYLRATDTYRELYASGIRNGALLYNMGTAFLMAEHYDLAKRALIAAEIYDGTTPAIARNLMLAYMEGDPGADAALPWYRLPLAWHFKIPLYGRITLTVLAVTSLWGIAILRLLGWRRGWPRLFGPVVLVTIILGTSVLVSLHTLGRARSDLLLWSDAPAAETAP